MAKKKVEAMKEVKGELSFNHVLITRDIYAPSILITNLDKRNSARDVALKDVQKVVKVGPYVKAENGINIKAGDKVLLDMNKLSAKNASIKTIPFNKETGEYVQDYNGKDDDNIDFLLLITDREILMKIG